MYSGIYWWISQRKSQFTFFASVTWTAGHVLICACFQGKCGGLVPQTSWFHLTGDISVELVNTCCKMWFQHQALPLVRFIIYLLSWPWIQQKSEEHSTCCFLSAVLGWLVGWSTALVLDCNNSHHCMVAMVTRFMVSRSLLIMVHTSWWTFNTTVLRLSLFVSYIVRSNSVCPTLWLLTCTAIMTFPSASAVLSV